MATIEVVVHPDGSTKVEVDGATGDTCTTMTHNIELVLGGAGKRTEKPEYSLPADLGGIPINDRF